MPTNYSWTVALWKTLRGALLGALAIFLTSGGLDYFFQALTTGVGSFGLPVWAIPVVTAGIVFLRNFLKQYLANRVPPVAPPPAQ